MYEDIAEITLRCREIERTCEMHSQACRLIKLCENTCVRKAFFNYSVLSLEASPVCRSNMKPEGIVGPNSCGLQPEDLQLSCLVLYHGNHPPIIIWKKVGTESPISAGTFRNVSDKRVIYYLKMEVNSGMDGSSYQCQTTRSATAQYACTSEIVKVIGCEYHKSYLYDLNTTVIGQLLIHCYI